VSARPLPALGWDQIGRSARFAGVTDEEQAVADTVNAEQ
jgi:hypothetical protein